MRQLILRTVGPAIRPEESYWVVLPRSMPIECICIAMIRSALWKQLVCFDSCHNSGLVECRKRKHYYGHKCPNLVTGYRLYCGESANTVTSSAPQPVTMSSGQNLITYDLSTGLATFANGGQNKITNFYSQAYSGSTLYRSTSSSYTRTASNGAKGETDITLIASDGSPAMIQRFRDIPRSNFSSRTIDTEDGTNSFAGRVSAILGMYRVPPSVCVTEL
jgi:hypothetical protein